MAVQGLRVARKGAEYIGTMEVQEKHRFDERSLARFMAARQKQAMQELYRHGLRLPRELEDAGLKIGARNEDSLPFMR